MYTRQSPHRLEVLRESAVIESAIASNRMEGVEIDRSRVDAVLRGKAALTDRNEEEVRNYQQALGRIHGRELDGSHEAQAVTLHRILRGTHWDAGAYKEKNNEIIEKLPGGGERIRFVPVPVAETPAAMTTWSERLTDLLRDRKAPALVCVAAASLDLLCIHPFRDGNGRLARLLLLEGLYTTGFEAGRYVSLERLIEQSKDRYYETLESCSQDWHGGTHDAWPYINYLLYTVRDLYRQFEERLGNVKSPKGAKTQMIEDAVAATHGTFRLAEISTACPSASIDMVRTVLRRLQQEGQVVCEGRGQKALWRKITSSGLN